MAGRMARAGINLSNIQVDVTSRAVDYREPSNNQDTSTDSGHGTKDYFRPFDPADHLVLERTPDSAEDHASEIVPNFLFLGSDDVASNLNELQAHNITHILNMSRECRNHFEPIPTERPFVYLKANLADNPFEDFYNFIPRGINFIESAFSLLLQNKQAAVLVHCWAGRSRSPCMVIAYLMYKHGYRLDSAVDLVRNKRPDTITSTFLDQLRDFEFYLARTGHFEIADTCRAKDQPFLPRPIPEQISPPASERPMGAGQHQSKSLQQLTLFSPPTRQEQQTRDERVQEQLLTSGLTPGSTTPGLTVITRTPSEQRKQSISKPKVQQGFPDNTPFTPPSDVAIAKIVSSVNSKNAERPPEQPLPKEAAESCCIVM